MKECNSCYRDITKASCANCEKKLDKEGVCYEGPNEHFCSPQCFINLEEKEGEIKIYKIINSKCSNCKKVNPVCFVCDKRIKDKLICEHESTNKFDDKDFEFHEFHFCSGECYLDIYCQEGHLMISEFEEI